MSVLASRGQRAIAALAGRGLRRRAVMSTADRLSRLPGLGHLPRTGPRAEAQLRQGQDGHLSCRGMRGWCSSVDVGRGPQCALSPGSLFQPLHFFFFRPVRRGFYLGMVISSLVCFPHRIQNGHSECWHVCICTISRRGAGMATRPRSPTPGPSGVSATAPVDSERSS